MYFVYVLESLNDGSFYKGITNNVKRRLKEHNLGKNLSTKYKRPLRLVFQEEFKDRKTAREQEKWLKSGEGREFLKDLINRGNKQSR